MPPILENNDADSSLSPYEVVASDWESAIKAIDLILAKSEIGGKRELAWRGVTNSKFWPDNSLYRQLLRRAQNTSDPGLQHPPFEADMRSYETKMVEVARTRWRFDHLSALELLAQVRHYGGHTRLLDVTYNPLIALWFAVEELGPEDQIEQENDAVRLYAFDVTERKALLDKDWGGRDIPWDSNSSLRTRKLFEDEPYWIWKPPGYNERISAQNSAFLISKLSSLDELLCRYASNPDFLGQLSTVPSLINKAQNDLTKFTAVSLSPETRKRFLEIRDVIRGITLTFEALEVIGGKVNDLIMERLHLEILETGRKFQPSRIFLDQQIAVLKGLAGDAASTPENWTDSYDEYVNSGPLEDLEAFLSFAKSEVEELVGELEWLGEQTREIENWILRVGEEFQPSSISLEFSGVDGEETPGPLTAYTVRIEAVAKPEIRAKLEYNYGYNAATLYPDLMGFAVKGGDFIS